MTLPVRYWPYTLTLVLLTVVLGFLALVSCWGPFRDRCGCLGPNRIKDAEIGLQAVRGATTMWLAEKAERGCPTTADLVAGGYLDEEKSTTDPWGREMSIDFKGTRVTVTSAGPDGLFGTGDDIE